MSNVLFVCKENEYRSQIAEALFNSMTIKHHAISAAGEEPAKKVSKDAISLLKRVYGINMSQQKPKRLTKSMLDNADKIIILCDPKDCILIPKSYATEHWDIPKMETLDEESKIKEVGTFHQKIAELIAELN
jgi:protein-tyrosine-phosphatase